jgi:hypothetical protein
VAPRHVSVGRDPSEIIVGSVVVEVVDLGFDKSAVQTRRPPGRGLPDGLHFQTRTRAITGPISRPLYVTK